MTKEKQQHGTYSQQSCQNSQTDEYRGSLEREIRHPQELFNSPFALLSYFFGVADGPQTEFPGIVSADVPDPLRGHERNNPDDGIADRENRPQDADGFGIAHVTGRVYLRRIDVFDFRSHFDVILLFYFDVSIAC